MYVCMYASSYHPRWDPPTATKKTSMILLEDKVGVINRLRASKRAPSSTTTTSSTVRGGSCCARAVQLLALLSIGRKTLVSSSPNQAGSGHLLRKSPFPPPFIFLPPEWSPKMVIKYSTTTGERSNQDQTWWVNFLRYIDFCVYYGSWSLWCPVRPREWMVDWGGKRTAVGDKPYTTPVRSCCRFYLVLPESVHTTVSYMCCCR